MVAMFPGKQPSSFRWLLCLVGQLFQLPLLEEILSSKLNWPVFIIYPDHLQVLLSTLYNISVLWSYSATHSQLKADSFSRSSLSLCDRLGSQRTKFNAFSNSSDSGVWVPTAVGSWDASLGFSNFSDTMVILVSDCELLDPEFFWGISPHSEILSTDLGCIPYRCIEFFAMEKHFGRFSPSITVNMMAPLVLALSSPKITPLVHDPIGFGVYP